MSTVVKFQPQVVKDDLPTTGWTSQEIRELVGYHGNSERIYQHLRGIITHPAVKDGWVFHTYQQWKNNLDLGRDAVDTAVANLKARGLIRTEVRSDKPGVLPKTYYFLEPLQHVLEVRKGLPLRGALKSPCGKPAKAFAGNQHSNNSSTKKDSSTEYGSTAAIFDDCQGDVQEKLSGGEQEEGEMKSKQVQTVSEALGKVSAPSDKMKNSPERLYALFRKECAGLTDAEYPELTKKTRAMMVALKKEFGEQIVEFLTQVVRNWGDASAYVSNREGCQTPKYPGIEFIRTGSHLMWFKQWWVERNTPLPELKIKSAVVIPFKPQVVEVAEKDKPMSPEEALAALKQWQDSKKTKE
jgi:hypothetical protein